MRGGVPISPAGGAPAAPSTSPFPAHDWQFWVVTIIALVALAWLLRGVAPIPVLTERWKRRRHQRRAALTIEGKAVGGERGGQT